MATIFLTSTGFSVPKVRTAFKIAADFAADAKVFVITTASREGTANKYVQSSIHELKEMGFSNIHCMDVVSDDVQQLKEAKIIYVCGGNTFYLVKALRDSGADQLIKDFCQKEDVIYVGVSAGSIVVGTSIASAIGYDENEVSITDLRGLAIVPYVLMVHYIDQDQPQLMTLQKEFHDVRPITDQEAIVRMGDTEQKI